MKELAIAEFFVTFKRELIQFQGLISFALLLFWVMSLWKDTLTRLVSTHLESLWMFFCLAFGLFITVVSALDWGSEFILVAIAVGLSVGLAMTHRAIAVCFLTSLLFLRPWELLNNNDYFMMLPKLSFGICTAHILLNYINQRKIAVTWDHTMSCVVAFAVWAFITTFKAGDPSVAQFEYSETLFKAVLLYALITNVLQTAKDLRTLNGTILAVFFFVAFISIYQALNLTEIAGESSDTRLRGFGAFANSNDIAALMVLAFPFGMITAADHREKYPTRIFGGLVVLVTTWAIYLSQSRGAMLALAVAIGFFVVKKIQKRWLTILFIVGASLSIPGYLALSSRNAEDMSESSSSRITYLKTGLVMAMKNPVFGVGFSGYEEKFEQYATEILYEWGHRTAHNSWILALAETGPIGLVLFVGMFWFSARAAWRIFPVAPEYFLALIGYGVTMTFLSHTYLLYPYLLYAMISVAARVYAREPGTNPELEASPNDLQESLA